MCRYGYGKTHSAHIPETPYPSESLPPLQPNEIPLLSPICTLPQRVGKAELPQTNKSPPAGILSNGLGSEAAQKTAFDNRLVVSRSPRSRAIGQM